ncbi:hypothetical protein DSO57_1022106 [Entomophthora muscae]|uniref:Uncharacterized protein n=1 Tax=Entomophthora muscae TaxID=34485 RepID=A0ACC2U2M9_9FUNG|nr:hypothetical protein DSO57_1022106 [Entomophthora muscae]
MACWRDDNKALSQKIASLEAKLLGSLSQEDLDLSHSHHPQACQEACKGKVPLHLTPPHLLPLPPSSSTSSPNSSNKSDDSLTDHSFYKSEGDSKPTKERCTKNSKAAKKPTSYSGKKRRHPSRPQRTLSLLLLMALPSSLI